MFKGIATYDVLREFYGKSYHSNFRKLVCTIGENYYLEEFWTDKTNKYFIRLFDFRKNELNQINTRFKTNHKSKLNNTSNYLIKQLNLGKNIAEYAIEYELDFGFRTTNKYLFESNTGIEIDSINSDRIRICSKLPEGNSRIANYFKEEPDFKYRQAKEYRLTSIQAKQIKDLDEQLKFFENYEIVEEKLNRYIHKRIWGKKEWKEKFDKRMIIFYQDELNMELTNDAKENIGSFNTIHFGTLSPSEYNEKHKLLREFEKKYDQ